MSFPISLPWIAVFISLSHKECLTTSNCIHFRRVANVWVTYFRLLFTLITPVGALMVLMCVTPGERHTQWLQTKYWTVTQIMVEGIWYIDLSLIFDCVWLRIDKWKVLSLDLQIYPCCLLSQIINGKQSPAKLHSISNLIGGKNAVNSNWLKLKFTKKKHVFESRLNFTYWSSGISTQSLHQNEWMIRNSLSQQWSFLSSL